MSPGRPPEARIERATRSAQLSMSVLRIADDRGLAGRAARGVDAHDLLARHREQAERIGVAQVRLGGEREAGQILEVLELVRMRANRLALGTVRSDVVVGVTHRPFQPVELQSPELVGARGLDRFQPGWPLIHQTRSTIIAMPWPTPMHMVHRA